MEFLVGTPQSSSIRNGVLDSLTSKQVSRWRSHTVEPLATRRRPFFSLYLSAPQLFTARAADNIRLLSKLLSSSPAVGPYAEKKSTPKGPESAEKSETSTAPNPNLPERLLGRSGLWVARGLLVLVAAFFRRRTGSTHFIGEICIQGRQRRKCLRLLRLFISSPRSQHLYNGSLY